MFWCRSVARACITAAHVHPLPDQLGALQAANARLLSTHIATPHIPAKPQERRAAGTTWRDAYAWLEEPGALSAVLAAERQAFDAWRRSTSRLQRELEQEMLRLLPGEQESAPERVGDYLYSVEHGTADHTDTPGCGTHPVYVRVHAATGARQVVLDVNELAALHGDDVSVGQIKLSPGGQRLLFTYSHPGAAGEACAACVRDLSTGAVHELPALRGAVGAEWAAGGRGLLYTLPDELGRASRVLYAEVPDPACVTTAASGSEGRLVYEDPDPAFFVDVAATKDGAYLILSSQAKTCSELRVLPASDPLSTQPVVLQARTPGLEYFAEHHDGSFYLVSNARGAQNYGLFRVRADLSSPGAMGEGRWEAVLPERPGLAIHDMDAFQQGLVLYETLRGAPHVSVLPLGHAAAGASAAELAARLYQVPLPRDTAAVSPGANADFDSRLLRFSTCSPVRPESAADWDLAARRLHPASADAAPASGLAWRQLRAGPAGAPLTVLYGQGLRLDGSAPCLVAVYGAYGHSLEAEFRPEHCTMAQRGWVVALAHARGGGELGRAWHHAGRGADKLQAVIDLEACVDNLIDAGYTAPGRVALEAASAGGVAAGGLLNRRPGLVGAALLEAPFVDVLTAMADPGLPLTAHEYDEWGDPAADFEQVRAICPYQGVRRQAYPPALITCSQTDGRVPAWGPAKYAAALRAQNANTGGGGPVLLCPDEHEGHFLHERRRYAHKALLYSFLVQQLQWGG